MKLSYQEALDSDCKDSIQAITATSGGIDRIAEFPELVSLELKGNKEIQSFDFLTCLPKLQKLYLGDMGLTEIPKQVATLKGLEVLLLGGNSIKDFALLDQLPALVDLGLESMSLRKIPDPVLKLTQLKVLGLYGNSIGSLTALKKLPNIEELYVAGNQLKKLPKELKKLGKLRRLDIMNNNSLEDYSLLGELMSLEELTMTTARSPNLVPHSLFELEKLTKLEIVIYASDDMAGISNIGTLVNLEELTIYGSSLNALPKDISKLKKLRVLNLKGNEELADISAIRDLPALQELVLSSCNVASIEKGFSTLKALRELNLSHNDKLGKIEGLADLPNLEKLTLFGKRKDLPASLGTLKALKELNLSAKASNIDFLQELTALEELYISNEFDALPPLPLLRQLTVYRKKGDDAYLANLPSLEELELYQPQFCLPILPKLKKLNVGRIETTLDLSNLAKLPVLEDLSINRSDTLAALPAHLSEAKALKKLLIEFMPMLTDLSALRDLPELEELSIKHADTLPNLPATIDSLAKLHTLSIYNAKALTDIDAIGLLATLTNLSLERVRSLKDLPESLANLSKLEKITLDDVGISNVDILLKIENLKEFVCEDCDDLSRKRIAEVHKSIQEMLPKSDIAPAPQMSYQQFMEGGSYSELSGKEDCTQNYPFPLYFATPETLLEMIEDFSWTDDHRDDEDSEGAEILTVPESVLKPLAVLDWAYEGCDTSQIDSYCEEIFLVDTQNPNNEVYLWGHDGSPRKIHDTFDAFLASLRNFSLNEEDEEEDNEEEASENRTYLEFVDDTSSKFWQIVVTDASHEVTYGKIGQSGTSKSKDFDDAEAAQASAAKLIKSKTKKGYQAKE